MSHSLWEREWQLRDESASPDADRLFDDRSKQLRAKLFTADRPLYDRTRTTFPLIHWFTDYRSP